jgi:branched-chain amino acid transport system permease protein
MSTYSTAAGRRTRNLHRCGMLVALLVVVLLLAFPAISNNSYELGRVQLGMVYILVALGLNVAYGLAGEFTLGHVVVMATGAYSAGILTAIFGWNVWLALVASVLIGMGISLALGAPSVRVKGAYLGLLTLFAVLAIRPVVELGAAWTGGENGLLGIPLIDIAGLDSTTATYLLTVMALILVVLGLRNFVRSHWGTRFALLRDAPRAAESVGFNNSVTKFVAYAIYGAVASLAGVLMAYNDATVIVSTFNINLTLLVLTGVVLGGKGTLWGPIVGTVPLVLLSFYVGAFSDSNPIVFGTVLVVAVLLFPNGVVPAIRDKGIIGWLRSLIPGRSTNQAVHSGSHEVASSELEASAVSPAEVVTDTRRQMHGKSKAARGAPLEPLLEIDDLSKSFGGIAAINGVTLSIARGQVVGLVGQNGCGKSTLLNLISGFYTPDNGSITIDGKAVTGTKPSKIARSGVGRTFQVPRLVEHATVAENISAGLIGRSKSRLFASILGLTIVRKEARLRYEQAVEMVKILGLEPEAADILADSLPLGVKRIVEVGRAAVAWPSLLLLDEPAAGLNEDERNRLSKTVKALASAGITPIVVEHNIEFVVGLCDTVILMESGAVASIYDKNKDERMPDRMIDYLQYDEVE